MNKKFVGFGIAMASLITVAGGQQAQAGQVAPMTLDIQDYTSVEVTSVPAFTVTPSLADIEADVVETDASATATADPIELTINSTAGSQISWAGDGGAGGIADTDIKLKVGSGAYVAEGPLRTSVDSTPETDVIVPVNVQISNLKSHAIGNNYTNTLTFSIIAD